MKLILSIVTVLMSFAAALAEAQTINIYAITMLSENKIDLGYIEYFNATRAAKFIQYPDLLFPSGDYCIGTSDIKNLECFTYTYLDDSSKAFLSKQFNLQLDKVGNISHISLINSNLANVIISKFESSPSPNLNPAHNKHRKIAAPPIRRKTTEKVSKDNGQTEEVDTSEEVVDERSWIQKNWVYLVVPLGLLLFK